MKTVTVKGIGKISRRPDEATLDLTVEAAEKTYAGASAAADKRTGALKTALASAGFAADLLRTSSYSVDAAYENVRGSDGVCERRQVGYKCTHRLTLTFPLSRERLAAALNAAADSGACSECTVRFSLSDGEEAVREALASACRDAAERAGTIARACGAALGSITEVVQDSARRPMQSDTVFRPQLMRAAAADITPDDVRTEESVTITWELL